MNDESLESLLLAADRSAGQLSDPRPDLPARVRCRERRRRNRLRRTGFLVALMGGYLAGVSTVQIWEALGASRAAPTAERAPGPLSPSDTPGGRSGSEGGEQQRETPRLADTSQPAPVSIPSAYELLRELGLQHERNGKFRSALDCYRSALDVASEEELAIGEDKDTWLLASVKKDRRAACASQKPTTKGDST